MAILTNNEECNFLAQSLITYLNCQHTCEDFLLFLTKTDSPEECDVVTALMRGPYIYVGPTNSRMLSYDACKITANIRDLARCLNNNPPVFKKIIK